MSQYFDTILIFYANFDLWNANFYWNYGMENACLADVIILFSSPQANMKNYEQLLSNIKEAIIHGKSGHNCEMIYKCTTKNRENWEIIQAIYRRENSFH